MINKAFITVQVSRILQMIYTDSQRKHSLKCFLPWYAESKLFSFKLTAIYKSVK